MIQAQAGGALGLYHNGATIFQTKTGGATLLGASPYTELLLQNSGGTNGGRFQTWISGNDREVGIAHHDQVNWFVRYDKNNSSGATAEYHWQHIQPASDNNYDLGSSSKRWRNLYTTDLHLSNKGKTNDVDGTWGDWTLQEGENKIFMINNRTGKKYSLKLEEE